MRPGKFPRFCGSGSLAQPLKPHPLPVVGRSERIRPPSNLPHIPLRAFRHADAAAFAFGAEFFFVFRADIVIDLTPIVCRRPIEGCANRGLRALRRVPAGRPPGGRSLTASRGRRVCRRDCRAESRQKGNGQRRNAQRCPCPSRGRRLECCFLQDVWLSDSRSDDRRVTTGRGSPRRHRPRPIVSGYWARRTQSCVAVAVVRRHAVEAFVRPPMTPSAASCCIAISGR